MLAVDLAKCHGATAHTPPAVAEVPKLQCQTLFRKDNRLGVRLKELQDLRVIAMELTSRLALLVDPGACLEDAEMEETTTCFVERLLPDEVFAGTSSFQVSLNVDRKRIGAPRNERGC